VVLALGASCSRKALQPDAGGGGTLNLDGGATDLVIAADAAWEAPFVGREAFNVTASVRLEGGTVSHTFAMLLDGDRQLAIAGAYGAGTVSPVQQLGGGRFRITSPMTFVSRSYSLAGDCYDTFTYDDITFSFDLAGRLVGTGNGEVTLLGNNGDDGLPATMSLIGYVDGNAPGLDFSPSDSRIDPFTPFSVLAEEPLPPNTRLTLQASGGDVVMLTPAASAGDFVISFAKPPVLLRYGQQYTIDVRGLIDFGGNTLSGSGPGFTTYDLPPLVAEDGFESLNDALIGAAGVLHDTDGPTINGARSLWFPPRTDPPEGAPLVPTTQFALRLALSPGDTVVRFSYRTVNPGPGPAPSYAVASAGGTIVTMDLPADDAVVARATVGTSEVTLGPIATATIALPSDAAGEIVLARIAPPFATCGAPKAPPVAGIIIDDLRAE
jgi:hypothetical protein